MLSEPILEVIDAPVTTPIIKVIGVGGGGCNAVSYMYSQGIADVTFTVCNTDQQALRASNVPTQLLLGEGLGAGTKVDVGRAIGERHVEDFKKHLDDGTRMVFVATGLGGGTGTAVAPIVARVAREMGILTVGVVTLPFAFEENRRIQAALDGLEEMRQVVDALIVINNERVIRIYPELTRDEAMRNIDEVLCTAVRSITEIITRSLRQNADFNDVRTTLENSGLAVMNQVKKKGAKRIYTALTDIVNSPLLNNRNVYDAQRLLMVVRYPHNPDHTMRMAEYTEIEEFMTHFRARNISCKHAIGEDVDLEDEVCVTLLLSGFSQADVAMPEAEEDTLSLLDKSTAEAIAKREVLYGQYYGTDVKHKVAEPFVFAQIDDLDNNLLIEQLASQPAYKRTIMSNLALQRKATADNESTRTALSSRHARPDTPVEVIHFEIDKGETYQLP